MITPNYIPDQNPFHLAGPPSWWLRKLWDFDASLVVVPSRQECIYRLAQRRRLNLPDHIVNDALFKQSDTQMLASYSLVPVTTILATANWSNPLMWQELASRAPHRQGGAAQVINRIEAQEERERLEKQAQIEAHNTALAKDSWNLYLKKIGLRSQMWSPTIKAKPAEVKENRAPSLKLIKGNRP